MDKPEPRNVEEFISLQDASRQAVLRSLRMLIQRQASKLKEGMRWGNPCYSTSEGAPVLSVYCIGAVVNLGFFKGAQLKDTGGLLKGGMASASMRHIVLKDVMAVQRPQLAALIKQAAELP